VGGGTVDSPIVASEDSVVVHLLLRNISSTLHLKKREQFLQQDSEVIYFFANKSGVRMNVAFERLLKPQV
jgi:hypothetical protein